MFVLNRLACFKGLQHHVCNSVRTLLYQTFVRSVLKQFPSYRIGVTLISRLSMNIQDSSTDDDRPDTYLTSTFFSFNRNLTDTTTQETGDAMNPSLERTSRSPPHVQFELSPRNSRRDAEASGSSGLTT